MVDRLSGLAGKGGFDIASFGSNKKSKKKKNRKETLQGDSLARSRVLDEVDFQSKSKTKKRSLKRDKGRNALPPGKRISKNGNVYYEYRGNRTDLNGV